MMISTEHTLKMLREVWPHLDWRERHWSEFGDFIAAMGGGHALVCDVLLGRGRQVRFCLLHDDQPITCGRAAETLREAMEHLRTAFEHARRVNIEMLKPGEADACDSA